MFIRSKENFVSFKELLHMILNAHLDDCKMFEGLNEKGQNELEKQEMEFHYKLALKALMQVFNKK